MARISRKDVTLKGHRNVCFDPGDGPVKTPIYDRYKLTAGAKIPGPAVLEEFDSTVLIHPGHRGTVDEFGSVHIGAMRMIIGAPVHGITRRCRLK